MQIKKQMNLEREDGERSVMPPSREEGPSVTIILEKNPKCRHALIA